MGKKVSDREYKRLSEKTVLPDWLVDQFPEPKPVVTISYSKGLFHVTGSEETFLNITEAYDAYDKKDQQVVLDPSVHKHGGKLVGGMFFCERDKDTRTARLLISHTSDDTVSLLKYEYGVWLTKTNPFYQKNKNDWVVAYNWLTQHPVFWYRYKNEKTFDWETYNGLKSLTVWVTRKGKRSIVDLEHGAHVEDDFTHFYHDIRLDVSAANFEQAYIALAKKVNKFFNADGTEKENVKYKKSKSEKKLDKTLAELTNSELSE